MKITCYDHDGDESGSGSGFFAYDGKTIVTNYHVMEEAYTCTVSTEQDKTYTATKIIAYYKERDIAIISLEEDTGLTPLTFGDSDAIKKGEKVVAVGSPLGIKNTVSTGVLSGRVPMNQIDVLQFTAPISGGSSGGALFNDEGQVIGITFASYENGQNLNLAIPIAEVKELHDFFEGKNRSLDINGLYIKKYPFVPYLDQYKNYVEVTLEELKQNPEKYNGKRVKVVATVSSTSDNSALGRLEYICLPGYQTNDLYRDKRVSFLDDFESHAWCSVSNYVTGEDGKADVGYNGFLSGDVVVVIGEFQYTIIEDLSTQGLIRGICYKAKQSDISFSDSQ